MPRKKRISLIIASVIIIVVTTIIILLCLFLLTDIFKSDEEMFTKYALKTFENIDLFLENKTDTLIENEKYTSNMELNLNYITDINTTSEKQSNDLNKLKLNIDSKIDKTNNYDYKDIYIQKESNKIGEIEYIKDNDIYGVHLSGIKQYISVEENELTNLAEKLKLEENVQNVIAQLSDFKLDLSEFKFNEDEQKKLANIYSKILYDNVSNKSFEKQNNALITIDEKDVNTTAYSLTLNKEQYNNLKIKFLEQLKSDEIILAKIELIQNKINKVYPSNSYDFKQKYIDYIERTIKEIKDTNIGQEEVKISVYANLKSTVRILIDDKTTKTIVDFINQDSNASIEINITKYDTVENSITAVLKKEKKDKQSILDMSFERIKNEEIQKLEFLANETTKDNGIAKTISVLYNNGTNQLKFNFNNDIDFIDSFKDKIELTDENNIILNTLDDEKYNYILNTSINIISEQIKNITEQINLNDFNTAFSIFSVGEKISINNNDKITENQKNRFNSQFEFYQGSEVDDDNIKNLLNALTNNTSNVEIISEDKDDIRIKITVESDKNDEEGISKIKDILDSKDNNRKKYKVIMGYADNGLINAIGIVYSKE